MTPHQCCRERPTKRSSALSSHMHTSKGRKTILPTMAITLSKGGRCTSSFQLSFPFTQQGSTKERTGHPRSRGTPCLNCLKNSKETGKQTQLKRARRSRSFSDALLCEFKDFVGTELLQPRKDGLDCVLYKVHEASSNVNRTLPTPPNSFPMNLPSSSHRAKLIHADASERTGANKEVLAGANKEILQLINDLL